MTDSPPPRQRRDLSRVIGWFGVALQVAVGVFPFAPSGLVLQGAPYYFVWAVWVAGFAAVLLLRSRAPRWTPAVPVLCVLIWLTVVAMFGSA